MGARSVVEYLDYRETRRRVEYARRIAEAEEQTEQEPQAEQAIQGNCSDHDAREGHGCVVHFFAW
jgi:hypothetical protein